MMIRNAILCCAIFPYAVSLTAAAVTEAPKDDRSASPPAMTAEQIVERNIAARGGLEAWHRVKSMSMMGKIDAGKQRSDGGRVAMLSSPRARAEMKAELTKAAFGKGGQVATEKVIQLPFQMDLKRPLKSRLEISFQGDAAVQVYDGSHGWKLRPFIGRHEVEPYSESEARTAAQQQELDGPLVDYVAKGTQVAFEGTERVDGHNAYRLKLTLKGGEVRHLWIDAQTFLDAKIDGAQRHFDGKMRPVATYFHDYRTVDGVKIPYLLETRVEGVRDAEKITIEKVVLNPSLDDSRFAKLM